MSINRIPLPLHLAILHSHPSKNFSRHSPSLFSSRLPCLLLPLRRELPPFLLASAQGARQQPWRLQLPAPRLSSLACLLQAWRQGQRPPFPLLSRRGRPFPWPSSSSARPLPWQPSSRAPSLSSSWRELPVPQLPGREPLLLLPHGAHALPLCSRAGTPQAQETPTLSHGRPLQLAPCCPWSGSPAEASRGALSSPPHGRELSAPPMASILWASPCSPAPCRHPLFLLSLPAPSPKQQVPAPPTSPMENRKPPPRPSVLATQLGLASSLSGHPSRCSTAHTTCSTICATGCMWSCWCSVQRLHDATDLRSAYESSSKPAVSSLLPRAFCVRLKGCTNESHNKLCNDCVCR
jgi:hypothetical protein